MRQPYWDEWHSIGHFRRFAEGQYGPLNLAEQHNEHRLVFPRIIFFADEIWVGLSGWLDLTATFCLQLTTFIIFMLLIVRRVSRVGDRVLLVGFVLLLMATLRQEQNFSNGFQLQFVGVFTATSLAVVAYVEGLSRMTNGMPGVVIHFAAASLFCAVATFTMANGVLAGPVLVVVAILWRARARVIFGTFALSGMLALVFFHGYVPGQFSFPLRELPSHFLAYPRFVTAYLGNPLGSSLRATQALGLVGLLLLTTAAWRVARSSNRDTSDVVLVGIAGFVLATAASTAFGRVALGTEQAFESRYATPSLIFWCALAIFWWPVAQRSTWLSIALTGVMSVLVVAASYFEATAWTELAARSAALRRVSDSLLAGLYDVETASAYENQPPEVIALYTSYLREHHLAAFADAEYLNFGNPVTLTAPVAACEGSVSAVSEAALGLNGVRLFGRAVDTAANRPPRRVIITNASGVVIGYGSASLAGESSSLWTGYAKARVGDKLFADARLTNGSLCRLGEADIQVDLPTK